MPLSENEQRLLEQLEKALAAEDPKFASALSGRTKIAGGRFFSLAIVLLLAGIAMIVAAVALPLMPIGVVGFVSVLVGVLLITAPKPGQPATGGKSSKATKPDLMKRFEQRWDNRNQGETN